MKSKAGKVSRCPMLYTLSILRGKWKWIILWHIDQYEVIRFSELKERLHARLSMIADRTLSQQLKELEAYELIQRIQYNEVPPRVEYTLTEKGKTLIPVLKCMGKWGALQSDVTPVSDGKTSIAYSK